MISIYFKFLLALSVLAVIYEHADGILMPFGPFEKSIHVKKKERVISRQKKEHQQQ